MNILYAIYVAIGTLLQEMAKLATAVQSNSDKLDQVLTILTEVPPIAGAEITFKEVPMKALSHGHNGKIKFVLNDNGTATGTISFTDPVGAPTVEATGATNQTTLTSNNPAVTFVADATGLIVTATPVTPVVLPLATGVIVTASIIVTNPDASVLGPFACDNSADPMNVTATGPGGASITFA